MINTEQMFIQSRQLNFFMVGNDIADTEELNIYEKAICYQIARYSNSGNIAFPSYATLARKCGMSRIQAIRTVKKLIDKQVLLKVVRKDENSKIHKSNLYALNDNLHRLSQANNSQKQENIKANSNINQCNQNEEGSICEIPRGSICEIPGVVSDRYSINNNNINNILCAVDTDTSNSEVNKSSSKKNDNEDKQHKKKSTAKRTVAKIDTNSTYYRIMQHFNSKENTKYKSNSIEFMKNIDTLLEIYTEEEIIKVIDYIYEFNYKAEYFRPTTIFRLSNFERNFEFCEKNATKKACTNNVQAKTVYYIVNINTNKVIAVPYKPLNMSDDKIFSTREEAEASLL